MPEKRILIVCGEASGDLNAARLSQEILAFLPSIKISAVGGAQLRKAGADVFYDIKNISVLGIVDALKKLPEFLKLKKTILAQIKKNKPDLVILVDFSGFNLRLAKIINKSIPVIYYISPQVWASRQGRVKTIKDYVSKMLVLFKFEEEFYRRHGISVDFVGHPLLDIVKPTMEKKDFLKKHSLSDSKATLTLLPGSRKAEIKHILPVMLKACLLIRKQITDIQFVIAKSPLVDAAIYNSITVKSNLDLKIIEGETYDCMNIADLCLVASGTATLETALMQKPFAVIYKMDLLNYLLYLPQVKVPYIGMANIVAKKLIVPEFIQFAARPKQIASEAIKIITDKSLAEKMKNELSTLRQALGKNGAARRAAQIIVDFLNIS